MRGWWREIAGLVLPVDCGGCGRPRTELCEECCAQLYGGVPRRVRPDPEPAGLPVVHAAAGYENAVRAVLLAHKERGVLGLAGAMRQSAGGCCEGRGGVVGRCGAALSGARTVGAAGCRLARA